MKTHYLMTLVLLAGCANFDSVAWERGLRQASQDQNQIYQNNMELNQQMALQRQTVTPATVATTPQMMVLPGYLKSQSLNGTLRYCSYTNGVVTTVASVSVCPMNTQ